MAATYTPSSNNLYIGRGTCFFDPFIAGTTTKTGEINLGNCETLSLSVEEDVKEKYSSMVSTSDLLLSVPIKKTWKLKLTGNEFYKEILARIAKGTVSTLTQSGSTASGEQITGTSASIQGRWYPCTYRKISSYTVKVGATPKTETTDYTVDAIRGRIYIVPGGGISDGSTVTIDYTYASIAGLATVKGGSQSTIEGFFRFIGDSATGPDLELQVWKVSLKPSKVLDLISDDFGVWEIEMDVLDDSTVHPTEPVFRIIYDAT